jgi:hypothetical protein
MIEEYIGRQADQSSTHVALPFDFKCYSFDGKTAYIGLYDRRHDHLSSKAFYTRDWVKTKFTEPGYPLMKGEIPGEPLL